MKRFFGILPVGGILIFMICFACGCASSDNAAGSGINPDEAGAGNELAVSSSGAGTFGYTEIEQLPEKYTVDMAVQNNDYIDLHGERSNAKAMDEFINRVNEKQKSFVRTTTFTIEGDPVIIDFFYDGAQFIVTMDTTRDQFAADRSIDSKVFQNLVQFDDLEAHTKYYIVTNEKEITKDIANRGFEGVTLKYDVYQ